RSDFAQLTDKLLQELDVHAPHRRLVVVARAQERPAVKELAKLFFVVERLLEPQGERQVPQIFLRRVVAVGHRMRRTDIASGLAHDETDHGGISGKVRGDAEEGSKVRILQENGRVS